MTCRRKRCNNIYTTQNPLKASKIYTLTWAIRFFHSTRNVTGKLNGRINNQIGELSFCCANEFDVYNRCVFATIEFLFQWFFLIKIFVTYYMIASQIFHLRCSGKNIYTTQNPLKASKIYTLTWAIRFFHSTRNVTGKLNGRINNQIGELSFCCANEFDVYNRCVFATIEFLFQWFFLIKIFVTYYMIASQIFHLRCSGKNMYVSCISKIIFVAGYCLASEHLIARTHVYTEEPAYFSNRFEFSFCITHEDQPIPNQFYFKKACINYLMLTFPYWIVYTSEVIGVFHQWKDTC